MNIDVLVAEIGSTTTVVSGFDRLKTNEPVFVGQGMASTTVADGDVTLGLTEAIADLRNKLQAESLAAQETFAVSSAAGGLKMSVHGLVYDMTVKAAKEAALGAGANLKLITAGRLDSDQLAAMAQSNLNIIMIAGGVDYGETETALHNTKAIADLRLNIPVIYAGNIQNQARVRQIFSETHQDRYLFIAPNVYPKIDLLAIEKTREIIQSVFEEHIVKAPGMEKVRQMITGSIIPTPGAVMKAALLLYESFGDLIAFDIGGATTDVHSVTPGSLALAGKMLAPEPLAKRTVEGDLGVFINKDNLVSAITKAALAKDLGCDLDTLELWLADYRAIPPKDHFPLVERLAQEALVIGIERHAGRYVHLYGPSGKTTYAEGKDLTNIKYAIGTGGALTRLPHGREIIAKALGSNNPLLLKPAKETAILIDTNYCMAACGVLGTKYPLAAMAILQNSLGIR